MPFLTGVEGVIDQVFLDPEHRAAGFRRRHRLSRQSGMANRLKALNGFSLGVERLEQRHQTGNGEEVMISRADVQ